MTKKDSIEKKTTKVKKVVKTSPKKKSNFPRENKWHLVRWALGLTVWVGLAMYAVQFVFSFLVAKLLPKEVLVSNVTNAVYQVVVYAAVLAVVIYVPWKFLKYKTTRDELGLRGLPTWTDLLLAPIGFIVTMIVAAGLTALMMALLPQIQWDQTQVVGYKNLYQLSDFILAFLCLVVLAPVCEEVIFRGWLYGKLRVRLPALPAMIIVSVLFGIMHGQWNVGVTVFAMSMGMCLMRELTGTVWSGVLLHMIKNGLAFYFLFVI